MCNDTQLRDQLEPFAQIEGGWYEVQCVPSYHEGLMRIIVSAFDVYVVDADLAGENPVNIVRAIRAADSDALIVSVSSQDQFAAGTQEAESDLLLPRSRALSGLRLTIDDLLDRRHEILKRRKGKPRPLDH